MEFFIKKNATLPILKLQVVKDGRSDYNSFMDMIEESAIFFSMTNVETGIPKISTNTAGFVEKVLLDPNSEPEYYIYYQFKPQDTNKTARYEAQFLLRNSQGVLILPIREQLFINVQESFIAEDLPYNDCYLIEFPCCNTVCPTTTTTTTTNGGQNNINANMNIGGVNMGITINDNMGGDVSSSSSTTTTTTTRTTTTTSSSNSSSNTSNYSNH